VAEKLDAKSALDLALARCVNLKKFKTKHEILDFTLHKVEHLGLQLLLKVEEKEPKRKIEESSIAL